ncbi:MAG: response regulator [Bacteroidota bacterium]
MKTIKVMLADDHALIREGFRSLLGKNELFEIVGEAENGKELMQLITQSTPDVVLVDINMPQMSGLEVLEQTKKSRPEIKFIILTMHEEREYIKRALTAGAEGYLLKNVEKAELEKAIKTVFEGGKYFSPLITNILAEYVAKPSTAPAAEISPREKEVLELVAQGFSTKQIADKLDISVRTVESHRINMLKKLEVSNTAELIRKSIELKILKNAG